MIKKILRKIAGWLLDMTEGDDIHITMTKDGYLEATEETTWVIVYLTNPEHRKSKFGMHVVFGSRVNAECIRNTLKINYRHSDIVSFSQMIAKGVKSYQKIGVPSVYKYKS